MEFRDAQPSDADDIAHVHAASWRTAYQGILTQAFLDHVAGDDRRRFWRTRFAEPDAGTRLIRVAVDRARIVAFMCTWLDRDDRWGALLDNLHVVPDRKGQGLGGALIGQAASWVIGQRPSSPLHLWVYEANHQAREFYERLGGQVVERACPRAPDGSDVPAVRYVWTDLDALARRDAAS